MTWVTINNFVYIVSKCVIDLNVKLKINSIMPLEENIGLNLYDLELDKIS